MCETWKTLWARQKLGKIWGALRQTPSLPVSKHVSTSRTSCVSLSQPQLMAQVLVKGLLHDTALQTAPEPLVHTHVCNYTHAAKHTYFLHSPPPAEAPVEERKREIIERPFKESFKELQDACRAALFPNLGAKSPQARKTPEASCSSVPHGAGCPRARAWLPQLQGSEQPTRGGQTAPWIIPTFTVRSLSYSLLLKYSSYSASLLLMTLI